MPITPAVTQVPSECHKALPTVTNMVAFTAHCLRLYREMGDLSRCCMQRARQEPAPALWLCFVRCLSWWLCAFIYFYLYIFFFKHFSFLFLSHSVSIFLVLYFAIRCIRSYIQQPHLTVTKCNKTDPTVLPPSDVRQPPTASHKICAKG